MIARDHARVVCWHSRGMWTFAWESALFVANERLVVNENFFNLFTRIRISFMLYVYANVYTFMYIKKKEKKTERERERTRTMIARDHARWNLAAFAVQVEQQRTTRMHTHGLLLFTRKRSLIRTGSAIIKQRISVCPSRLSRLRQATTGVQLERRRRSAARYGTLWPVKIRHFRRQSRMRACRPLDNCCRGVVASRRRFVDPVRIVLFQLNESTRYPYVRDRLTGRRGIIRNCFHHAFLPAYLRVFAHRIAFLNLVSGIPLIGD